MIRVGLVGFGLAGRVFHAPLISSVEGLELAAIVERSSGSAAARYPGITVYRTVDELLADASIKLVVVATPNDTHSDVALRALEAAKNVVVDKPVALTSAEIANLMSLAGGIGLQLFPFHNRRWDNDFQTIQKLVVDKSLGSLAACSSTFDRWRPGSSSRPWKENPDQGGLLLDIGTHLVDQALVLFGPPESVGAEVRHERAGEGTNDAFTIRLHYFSSFIATLEATCLGLLPRPRFLVRGTHGSYRKYGLDPQEEALNEITEITAPDWGHEPSERWGTLSVEAEGAIVSQSLESIPGDYRKFYEDVRDALLGQGPAPVAAVDAWRAARVLEYAAESARLHRDIDCDWSSEPS